MKKVLITDSVHQLLIDELEENGFICDYNPSIPLSKVRKLISTYEGIIINSKILMDQPMLDQGEKLEFIGRLGSGLEIIDLDYAYSKGVAVYNSPEGNCNAVAEHALGMLLCLANKIITGDRSVRKFDWNREASRGFELSGKIVGIIGFGHTGSQFAKVLSGMDVEILAFDKYKAKYADHIGHVKETTLNHVLESADIISIHLPFTEETEFWLDRNFFRLCKKGVILINTSRGKIVKTEDLIQSLRSGQVGGACLDVFENENQASHSPKEKEMYTTLHKFQQVVLTPHVAGWTKESKEKLANILVKKITKRIGNVAQNTSDNKLNN